MWNVKARSDCSFGLPTRSGPSGKTYKGYTCKANWKINDIKNRVYKLTCQRKGAYCPSSAWNVYFLRQYALLLGMCTLWFSFGRSMCLSWALIFLTFSPFIAWINLLYFKKKGKRKNWIKNRLGKNYKIYVDCGEVVEPNAGVKKKA